MSDTHQDGISQERAVRIIAGPFKGMTGTIVRTDPDGRVQIRLKVAGEDVVVQMPRAAIALVQ